VYVVVEAAAFQAKRYRTRVRTLTIIARLVMGSLLVRWMVDDFQFGKVRTFAFLNTHSCYG